MITIVLYHEIGHVKSYTKWGYVNALSLVFGSLVKNELAKVTNHFYLYKLYVFFSFLLFYIFVISLLLLFIALGSVLTLVITMFFSLPFIF